MTNGTGTWKSYLAVSLRLKIHLPHDPAIPPPGVYLRGMKTYVLKKADKNVYVSQTH